MRSDDFANGEEDPYDYYLAERLGMTVRELRTRMTTAEKAAWVAYDRYRAARQRQSAVKATLARDMRRHRGARRQ